MKRQNMNKTITSIFLFLAITACNEMEATHSNNDKREHAKEIPVETKLQSNGVIYSDTTIDVSYWNENKALQVIIPYDTTNLPLK